ncbi:putative transporter [Colletotrichum sidae]|uniref:Putative transporter n=1 Tax=Colletotrichum sidae TaxID=1347389 RepID=A0A4R8TB75_9PEZI|nr:putative transporter [Colletotrichum sidae]
MAVSYLFQFLDKPALSYTAVFLNHANHVKAVERVQENMTGIKSDTFKWNQCVEALTDISAQIAKRRRPRLRLHRHPRAWASAPSTRCAGNIIGPRLFFEREAPSYKSDFLAMLICYGIGVATCFVVRFYLVRENRRRDDAGDVLRRSVEDHVPLNLLDKTDKEIPQFRYVYRVNMTPQSRQVLKHLCIVLQAANHHNFQ